MTSSKLKILSVVMLSLLAVSSNAIPVLSNTQTNSGRQTLQREITPVSWNATPITTDGSDYSLTEINAEISDFNPAGTLFMEIWSVDSIFATPEAKLARLTLSSTNKTFTGNVPLLADTSYFIVTGVDNGGGQWFENSNHTFPLNQSSGVDFGVDAGSWTLETIFSGSSLETSYGSTDQGTTWISDALLNAPLRMDIQAEAVPEPTTVCLVASRTRTPRFQSARDKNVRPATWRRCGCWLANAKRSIGCWTDHPTFRFGTAICRNWPCNWMMPPPVSGSLNWQVSATPKARPSWLCKRICI